MVRGSDGGRGRAGRTRRLRETVGGRQRSEISHRRGPVLSEQQERHDGDPTTRRHDHRGHTEHQDGGRSVVVARGHRSTGPVTLT